MPAPLSVIIPTLNAADTIGPTLGSLSEGIGAGLIRELIIADGGSTDAIEAVADAVGAILVSSPTGRGRQLAAGAEAATSSWFLFLHADTVLPDGWTRSVIDRIANGPERAAYFDLGFDDKSAVARFVAGWANIRSSLFRLPFGDQGLLISRLLYERVGGYPELNRMEDVAIARALGRNMTSLGVKVTTSAAKYRENGWFRQGASHFSAQARYLITGRSD
jgi:rSAM/selenodomain-associated transferase 2